jgi:hypothetical protein
MIKWVEDLLVSWNHTFMAFGDKHGLEAQEAAYPDSIGYGVYRYPEGDGPGPKVGPMGVVLGDVEFLKQNGTFGPDSEGAIRYTTGHSGARRHFPAYADAVRAAHRVQAVKSRKPMTVKILKTTFDRTTGVLNWEVLDTPAGSYIPQVKPVAHVNGVPGRYVSVS